jgi:hypothetical protein
MLVSWDQNAYQYLDIKIGNSSFEKVSVQVIGNNKIQEKWRLNSGNACYHSVQNLLSSHLLLKNVEVRIYMTIILPVVLYGCETRSLTLREEHKLRAFENRVLRIFGWNDRRAEKTA